MEKKPIELSRRKMLAGLGTVGIAAGAAGFGTFSAFSDREETEGTFTAGELDGAVDYSVNYNGRDAESYDLITVHPDENTMAFDVPDLKPGDFGSIVFDINLVAESNPAWVFSCISVEDDGGQIDNEMLTIPFYDTNMQSSFFDSDGAPDSVDLADYGSGTALSFWDNAVGDDDGDGHAELAPQTIRDLVGNPLAQGTVDWHDGTTNVEEAPVEYDGCVLLNGDQENDDNLQGADPLSGDGTINFGYDWHLPFTTGNEVQGDTLTVLFGFDFQQYRHNSTPEQPDVYNPGENLPETTTAE